MRSIYLLPILLAGVFLAPNAALAYITVSSNISSNTTWTSSNIYVVQGDVAINSGVTLTIQPGTIVKFYDRYARLAVNGTLDAVGSSTDPVYFTSFFDDAIGGDTDGGGSSVGSAEYWRDIVVNSGGEANFEHSILRFGGSHHFSFTPASHANIYNNGGEVEFHHSTSTFAAQYGFFNHVGTSTITYADLSDNNQASYYSSAGLYVDGGSANISSSTISNNNNGGFEQGIHLTSGGNLEFRNNVLNGNGNAVYIHVGGGTTFSNSGNKASSNNINGIHVEGWLGANQTWSDDSIPYVVSQYGVTIPANTTLNIEPGAAVKFWPTYGRLTVNGTLNAIGGETGFEKIFFTSIYDDYTRDDATGDATSTAAAAGDWRDIIVNTGGVANIEGAIIRYGGKNHYSFDSTSFSNLYNNGGELNIDSSIISNSAYYGIRNTAGTTTLSTADVSFNSYGLYLEGGNASISASSTIHDNSVYGVYNATTNWINAEWNYWGDSSGPYHNASNTSGLGNQVSNYVDFNPWHSDVYYLVPEYIGTSVDGNVVRYIATSTIFTSELNSAVSSWNALGLITITATTTSPTTLIIADENDASDIAGKGSWNYLATPHVISLNRYFLDLSSTQEVQNTITHELGHALGLDHSYTGNVMFFHQTPQTSLGNQDINDYYHRWDP